jgi:LPXTG-site transpeptidase (sortase) family protein
MFYCSNSQVMKARILFLLMSIFFFFLMRLPLKEEMKSVDPRFLSIPSISLKGQLCSSGRDECLANGVWVKYFDERNNMLLTGHSFSLFPMKAGVFFNLENISIDDKIFVNLNTLYTYEVNEVFFVDRYTTEIENFEERENTLILYSCFPLWSGTKRLVVEAELCNLCEDDI